MNVNEYIETRLHDQQSYFNMKALRYKRIYFLLNIFVLILSASIPVITASNGSIATIHKTIITLLGSCVTVLSGVLSLTKCQEQWLHYRAISERLKNIEVLYSTGTAPYDNESTSFSLLVTTCENVINDGCTDWLKMVSDKQVQSNHSTSS